MCEFKEKTGNGYLVKIKNKIHLNDKIEIITPDEQFITEVTEIIKEGESVEVGNTNDDVCLKLTIAPQNYKYAIARTIGVKHHVS